MNRETEASPGPKTEARIATAGPQGREKEILNAPRDAALQNSIISATTDNKLPAADSSLSFWAGAFNFIVIYFHIITKNLNGLYL